MEQKHKWQEDTILDCLVTAGDHSSVKQDVIQYINSLLQRQKDKLAWKAWEYVVEAIRKEEGGKEEFLKAIQDLEV